MKTIRDIHNEAMLLSQQADMLFASGQPEDAFSKSLEAARLEAFAVERLECNKANEPTRSILLLSAASLAYQAKEFDYAERLVCDGLRGYPEPATREDLKELYEKIDFQRHLAVKGVRICDEDIQLTLQGGGCGFGFAPYLLVDRIVKNVSTLIARTHQRLANVPFSRDMRRKVSDFIPYTFALSPPRSGSFAITLKITHAEGTWLSTGVARENVLPADILRDFSENVLLLEGNNDKMLFDKIADDDYYINFISSMREIAPDGDKVRTVGFTTLSHKVSLKRRRNTYKFERNKSQSLQDDGCDVITIIGTLGYADKIKKNMLGIEARDGQFYTVKYKAGMSDIVRNSFDRDVEITGKRVGGNNLEIDATDIVPLHTED